MSAPNPTGPNWRPSFDEALAESRDTGKIVLLEFFDPNCGGCQYLTNTTFPDRRVKNLIDDETVPVQTNIHESSALRERYDAYWTPTLFLLDAKGAARHRFVPASLPPDEFIPVLRSALGRACVAMKRHDEAVSHLDHVVYEHPRSLAAPEALYWRGVALGGRKDPEGLRRAWSELAERYPASYWAKATTFMREKH